MSTIYDLITVGIFAGLAILFLQRSATPSDPPDHMYQSAPPAFGCAAANWLGTNQQELLALQVVFAVLIYSSLVLKPFRRNPGPLAKFHYRRGSAG